LVCRGGRPQYLGLWRGLEAGPELLYRQPPQIGWAARAGPITLTSVPVAASMATTLTDDPMGVNSKYTPPGEASSSGPGITRPA
jgi:hypothetical protein